MIARIRSAAFLLVFFGGTLFAVLLAFPVAALGEQALRRYALSWVRFHRWCVRWLLGIRTRIEGVVPVGPVLVAAKHQSLWEPLELLAVLHDPVVVMKRQLADIPLWGWIARRYGAIGIDRTGGSGALRTMLREADRAIAQHRSVVIFPEGTRVLPGEQRPLQPGFAGLYKKLGLPVVAVALDSGHVWPQQGWVRRAGTVTLRFGDPIPPGLPRGEIEARVHAGINALEPAI